MRLVTQTILWLAIPAAFYFSLSQSLTSMTLRDCQVGIHAACEQLQRDGINR